MPERKYTAASVAGYAYGYQGSENENELNGEGNSYTTYFRLLDVRLCRWLSFDPSPVDWESPYSQNRNNPISFTDENGDWPELGKFFKNVGRWIKSGGKEWDGKIKVGHWSKSSSWSTYDINLSKNLKRRTRIDGSRAPNRLLDNGQSEEVHIDHSDDDLISQQKAKNVQIEINRPNPNYQYTVLRKRLIGKGYREVKLKRPDGGTLITRIFKADRLLTRDDGFIIKVTRITPLPPRVNTVNNNGGVATVTAQTFPVTIHIKQKQWEIDK
jgi:RHS repeat-associated protein